MDRVAVAIERTIISTNPDEPSVLTKTYMMFIVPRIDETIVVPGSDPFDLRVEMVVHDMTDPHQPFTVCTYDEDYSDDPERGDAVIASLLVQGWRLEE